MERERQIAVSLGFLFWSPDILTSTGKGNVVKKYFSPSVIRSLSGQKSGMNVMERVCCCCLRFRVCSSVFETSCGFYVRT